MKLPTEQARGTATTPLVDGFGRVHTYLRIAVTDRCNLRCRYCMPHSGPRFRPIEHLLTDGEIARLVRLFARIGIHKVRLTGGEPLTRPGIEGLVRTVAETPGIRTVGLTTNGVLLKRLALRLRAAGLERLNISLDSLCPDRYASIAGKPRLSDALEGIDAAYDAGIPRVKLNMVVIGGCNDDEVLDFVALTRERRVQVRFIEYMPFPGNGWDPARVRTYEELRATIERECPLEPVLDAASDGVAREYRVPGFRGTIGFISPMSQHFCASCSRLRLTADGALKSCLFYESECSLRDALRTGSSDEIIETMVRAAIERKPEAHAPPAALADGPNRSMFEIGG